MHTIFRIPFPRMLPHAMRCIPNDLRYRDRLHSPEAILQHRDVRMMLHYEVVVDHHHLLVTDLHQLLGVAEHIQRDQTPLHSATVMNDDYLHPAGREHYIFRKH